MSNSYRNSEYKPIGDDSYQILQNQTQDDAVLKIFAYKKSRRATVFFNIISTIILGIPFAIFQWFPYFSLVKHKKSTLAEADVVYIEDNFGNCSFAEITDKLVNLSSFGINRLRYFIYQHTKYAWKGDADCFVKLDDFMKKNSLDEILENSHGLLEDEQKHLLDLYGPNKIDIEVKSYWRLFVEEVFNPFYIFQVFSILLWLFDDYTIYAGCVFFLTLLSIVTALIQTRRQSVALHNMVQSVNSEQVRVLRRELISKTPIPIESSDLVPGEVLIIPKTGCVMSCDAILLTGSCIVNESMLTGESVPVMKSPPHSGLEIYDTNIHKSNTLFSGTQVIQGRYYGGEYILARVVKTSFDTSKGSLVKSIMYPAPMGLKFYRDSLKFVFFLFTIAALGMCYCLYLYMQRNAEIKEIIIRTLDIITIVVPPALPAAMTVGIVYSQNRLKEKKIFCISPPRINVSGKLKLACFDKTGTLTHEGLELYSVLPINNHRFDEPVTDVKFMDVRSPLMQAMASCHSLTRINGKLNGDPLDLIMFENTKWLLEEPGNEQTNYDMLAPTIVKPRQKYVSSTELMTSGDIDMPYEIGIIRQFQFSSSLQRMSVICRILGSPNMIVYAKGAPEKIQTLCRFETIPPDFSTKLSEFAAKGFRVIAAAYKELPVKFKWKEAQKVKRETIECDLMFLGFIVMQNTLKNETKPVINKLHAANIKTVMITGDNAMTAICVARDCEMVSKYAKVVLLRTEDAVPEGIIPKIFIENLANPVTNGDAILNIEDNFYHFAMDGNTWTALRTFYPDLLPKILLRTTICARFQPDHKTQVIKALQNLDYIVSMVGDGANDCGALKAAHVGISLSQAEASVAAPFTSSIEDISCLIHLMREGRCALVTSFAVFKYMALYSLIQFISIIILYRYNSMLGDQQFLFIDLIITTSLAVTIGRQGPSHKLVAKRPMGSLVAGTNLVPMVLQIITCATIQLTALYYLTVQNWYTPNPLEKDEIIVCWENTVLFTVSSFQYVTMAVVFSKGSPHREWLVLNFWLLFCALSLICFTTYLCIYPMKQIADFFEVIYLPLDRGSPEKSFKDSLLVFPIAHFVIAFIIEFGIADSKCLKKLVHFAVQKKIPKNKYKVLMRENDYQNWFHVENDQSILRYQPAGACVC